MQLVNRFAAVALFVPLALAACGKSDHQDEQSPGNKVVAALKEKRPQCQTAVTELQQIGAVRVSAEATYANAEFDELNWAALDHEDKVRQALLVYCAYMPESGHYQIIVKGRHSGKTLASVTDGNYFDS